MVDPRRDEEQFLQWNEGNELLFLQHSSPNSGLVSIISARKNPAKAFTVAGDAYPLAWAIMETSSPSNALL
jgi:hypothetical protein